MKDLAYIQLPQTKLDARALLAFMAEVDRELEANPRALILDLTNVEHIDSLGIGVLALVRRKAGARRVALTGLRPFALRVARAAHLADQFEIIASPEAAREVMAG